MPVNTEPADKIYQCFEGLSQIIMNGVNQNMQQIIVGDLNAHIRGWCHTGQSDIGGRQLDAIRRTYGLTIWNDRSEFTCVRKNRNEQSFSLIDWTITTNECELSEHHTMNSSDIFSDHIPIMFQLEIDYTINTTHNYLNKLWFKLKNEKLQQIFKDRIQVVYGKIEKNGMMTNKTAQE